MKTLVVAEKPSVGRDIARVLKAGTRGEGYLSNDAYIVTWAIGHLVSLMEPDELNEKYARWRTDDLPILPETIPLKVLPDTKKQFDTVKKLMNSKEVSDIVCATDAGREGELIFRYIYTMAGCAKPVRRLWISSMTDDAITAGFASLRPSADYEGLYASAKCRSEADWMVGMNATRAFTLRYGCLLSAGRVQTPTLALIVKRDKEIAQFKPEPYWELTATFEGWKGLWFDPETKSSRIDTKQKADAINAKIKGKTGIVKDIKYEEKRVPPEKLYDLTTLQREANRKFGFSADKTLKLAQSLYETRKLITYPRTDSRYLPDDMKAKVISTLEKLPQPYAELVNAVRPLKTAFRIYDNAKISDHHAIVPTDKPSGAANLSEDEKKIYDLVVRRLIANHYPDYVYKAGTLITECEGETFKTNSVSVVDKGWKALYKDDADKESEDGAASLPQVNKGDKTAVKSASIKQHATKPPKPYTDDTLLKAMEDAGKTIEDEELREKMKDAGLGTPATRAAIITRLLQVGYVTRQKKQLTSTPKGRTFISVVPEQMSSALTTGKWERALAKMSGVTNETEISEKQLKFMQSIRRYSEFLVSYCRKDAPQVYFEKEVYKPHKGRRKSAK